MIFQAQTNSCVYSIRRFLEEFHSVPFIDGAIGFAASFVLIISYWKCAVCVLFQTKKVPTCRIIILFERNIIS